MSQSDNVTVELNKTDKKVLKQMGDEKRHDARELSNLLELDRSYLNTRLRYLSNMGLVSKVEFSHGMYEITENGKARITVT